MLNRRKLLDLNTEISGYDTAQLVYNVTSGTSTRLFGAGFTLSNIEKMTIDGISVNPVSEYEFDTSGEHNVAVKMVHNPGTRFEFMFFDCQNLVYMDLSQLDISEEESLLSMFNGASNVSGFESLEDGDVSNVKNMSYLFSCCPITGCIMLNKWNMKNVSDLCGMFYGCQNLTDTTGLYIKSSINDMSAMFGGCEKLTDISSLENIDFTPGASLSGCFYLCKNLNNIDVLSTWITQNCIAMGQMFYACQNLTSLEALRNGYVNNVSSFSSMFDSCTSLTSVEPIQSGNTANAYNFSQMFANCIGITSMDLSNGNVSHVKVLEKMFSQCELIRLDLTGGDTSSVTNMQGMFAGCNYLYEISGIKNFNTRNVTNFNTMFASCWSLRNLPELVYNFDTSSAITMNSMFNKCRYLDSENGIGMLDEEKLVDLDLSNGDLSNCTSMVSFLYDCRDLRSLTIRGSLKSTVNLTGMFTYLGSGTRPSGTFYYDTDSTYELIKTVLPAEGSAIKI